MSSNKQVRAQFKLNDLEPHQDPKGGYEPETVTLTLSPPDPILSALSPIARLSSARG